MSMDLSQKKGRIQFVSKFKTIRENRLKMYKKIPLLPIRIYNFLIELLKH